MRDFRFKRSWGPTPKYDLVRKYNWQRSCFIFIAGPCSLESKEQIHTIAKHVAECGATHLRSGVFRAGTYPGDNFGLIDESLLAEYQIAAHENGLKNIIEVLDYSPTQINLINKYSDCFQIGCRQMQNYTLLKKVAEYGKQTFLKRGTGNTIDEFLGAAEYLLKYGPMCDPVLIERGSSTNAKHVRWDLSISMIPAIKLITTIPILVDASHGTGRSDLVSHMTLAGIAAGADGCLVETHIDPDKSLSDKEQAIDLNDFKILSNKIKKIRECL